jgi:PPM family protein phosphatase
MQALSVLNAAGATDSGRLRDRNEDRYHFDPARGIFLVIDGVGGQAAGEKAAETALALVRARLERETGSVEDRVREAIGLANDEIFRLASLHHEWKGMACVMTIAVVTNGDVVVGHVGDTRLYKLRGGRLEKLTRDHSPVGEREDAGELSEREAMQHPRRNEVYRDVGSERHDPDDPGFIEVLRHRFEADAALLLCSDGLTDLVPSADILDTVRDFAGDPSAVARALIDAANAAGGKDNVTVVYVEGPAFATGEDTRDLRSPRAPMAASTPTPPARRRAERWRLLLLVLLLLTVAAAAAYTQRDRLLRSVPPVAIVAPPSTPAIVRPGDSIAAAVRVAKGGSEIVVEPGEYRERIELKSDVRLVSRVPRGAVLRLPSGASETDPAVVAFEVNGAGLSGFRILGDAATPLGAGVLVRNSTVTLSDLEIAGATTAAVEYTGSQGGSIVAGYFHDNLGAAIAVRTGTAPRIAHNAFVRNATSERAVGTLLIDADAHPTITANTFFNQRPESIVLPRGREYAGFARDNWFLPPPRR